jgi:tetratricopeptide (TPR) repeat protein
MYFPIAGLLGAMGTFFQTVKITGHKARLTAVFILAGVLIALSVRTIIRSSDWNNAIRLYATDVAISDNPDVEEDLGSQLVLSQQYAQALSPLIDAARQYPSDRNLFDLGNDYEVMGNRNMAKIYYIKAVNATNLLPVKSKHNVILYVQMSELLLLYYSPGQALYYVNKGLSNYPRSIALYALKALCYYKMHNQKQALTAAKTAQNLYPSVQTRLLYSKISARIPINLTGYSTDTLWILDTQHANP